jgi:gliding motility-associated-like protein
MVIPSPNRLRMCLAALVLSVSWLSAQSGIEITSNEPEFVTPCGDFDVFQVRVVNYNSNDISNAELIYQFPLGIEYQPGSVSGPGVSELNISNLSQPVFSISSLASGVEVVMNLEAMATCDVLENTTALVSNIVLNYGTNSQSYQSTPYNLNKPAIVISNSGNFNYQGQVGETFIRSFSIVNSGFGAVSDITIFDIHSLSSSDVLNVNGGPFFNSGDTTFINLGPAQFTNIGDGDGLFEQGETIIIQEEVEILGCEDGNGLIAIGWGCNDELCEVFLAGTEVSVLTELPDLDWSFVDYDFASFCESGFVEMEVTNNGNAGPTGSSSAYNIIVELGFNLPGSEVPLQDTCFSLDNFELDGQPTIALTNFSAYRVELNQFITDPDGPGGLDDLDGDGFFDDLAVGESFRLSMEVLFDVNCYPTDCLDPLQEKAFKVRNFYRNQCDQQFSDAEQDDVYLHGINPTTSSDDFLVSYAGGDTVMVTLEIGRILNGFDQACTDDAATVYMVLPPTLAYLPGFVPLLDGNAAPFSIVGDTLIIDANTTNYAVSLEFVTACDSNYIQLPGYPCAVISPLPIVNEIEYWVDYFCDVNTCADPIQLLCGTSNSFFVSCEDDQEMPDEGVSGNFFGAQRLTFGWTDQDLSIPVDPNDPGIAINTAMPFDEVELVVLGEVFGSAMYDSTIIHYTYYADQAAPFFDHLSDSLRFFDVETNAWYTCLNIGPTFITSQDGVHLTEFDLTGLTEPGGCLDGLHLTQGDLIELYMYVEVTPAVQADLELLPNFNAGFTFYYDGFRLGCNDVPGELWLTDPGYEVVVESEAPDISCDTIDIKVSILHGQGKIGNIDPFPFEYRPYIDVDSIYFQFPPDMEFVSGSALLTYETRPGNPPNGPIETIEIDLDDPLITQDAMGTGIFFVESDSFPIVDVIKRSTLNELTFQLLPNCMQDDPITFETTLSVEQYYYDVDERLPVSQTIEHTIEDFQLGLRGLNIINASFIGVVDTAVWVFEACNLSSGGQSTLDIPNNWLNFELPPSGIELLELIELTDPQNPITYPLETYGNGNAWAQVGTHPGNQCRIFELRAVFDDCDPIDLNLEYEFSCEGYPENPDSLGLSCPGVVLSDTLRILPQNADLQINLTTSPTGIVNLCETYLYELKIINTQTGNAGEVEVGITLPLGGTYFSPGSSMLQYGAGGFVSIPDPQFDPATNTYTWILSTLDPLFADLGLSGVNQPNSNELFIQFELATDCDYEYLSVFNYFANWVNPCSTDGATPLFFSQPLNVEGLPPAFNDYDITMEGPQMLKCGGGNPYVFSIYNLGDSITSPNERIRIIVDNDIDYVPNSFQNINNMGSIPGEPAIAVNDSIRIMEWFMPVGVGVGDSLIFEISLDAISFDSLDCGFSPMSIEILESAITPCATDLVDGICALQFVQVEVLDSFEIIETPYLVDNVSATAIPLNNVQEEYSFTFDFTPQGSPSTGLLTVNILADVNGNLVFDPSDVLLGQEIIDGATLTNGQSTTVTAQLAVDTAYTCGGFLLVLDPVENPCICTPAEVFVPGAPLDVVAPALASCSTLPQTLGGPALDGYTYSWSPTTYLDDPASPNPVYQYTGPEPPGGVFVEWVTVEVTRPGGCSNLDSIEITTTFLDAQLVALTDFNGFEISCPGAVDGAVEVTPGGGTGPYSYTWSDVGLSGPTVQDLAAGQYIVTMTDALGCEWIDSILLSEPLPIVLDSVSLSDYNGSNISCNGASDGSIEVFVSGGVAPLDLSWSNNDTGALIEDLPAGIYELTITDANGCEFMESFELIEPQPLSGMNTTTPIECLSGNNGSIEFTVMGGTGPYTVDTTTFLSTYLLDSLSAPGIYSVDVIDQNGCSIELSAEVEQLGSSFLLTTTDILCFGAATGSICVEPQSGFPPYSYQWSTTDITDCAENLTAGIYQVTVTDANDCDYILGDTIMEPEDAAIQIDFKDISCFGAADGSIEVSVSGATPPYTYNWTPAGSGPNLENLGPGTYMLTLIDANDCEWEAEQEIMEPGPLQIDFETTNVTCFEGDDASIIAAVSGGTAPYQLNWNIGGDQDTLTGLNAGLYELAVVDSNNCMMTMSVEITQPQEIIPEVEVTDISCFGEGDGMLEVIVPVGAGYMYSLDGINYQSSPIFDNMQEGDYQLSILDASNCSWETGFTVKEPEELIIDWTYQDVSCFAAADGQIAIILDGGTAPFTYNWGGTPGGPVMSNLGPGFYSITITEGNGCEHIVEQQILEPTALQINFDVMPVTCFGGENGSVTASISGGIPDYTGFWEMGVNDNTLENIPAGEYAYTAIDANGCELTEVVIITEPPFEAPDIVIQDISCFGQVDGQIEILSPSGAGFTYNLDNAGFQPDSLFTGLDAGIYSLVIQDPDACITDLDVSIVQAPSVLVTASEDAVIDLGEVIPIEAFGHPSVTDYIWTPASSLDCPTCPLAYATPLETTVYEILVFNENGCEDRDSVLIEVLKPEHVYIPNGFSPNGDGINDEFLVFGGPSIQVVEYMRVFNRWGGIVFDADNIAPNDPSAGWDGRQNGKVLNSGVYVYLVKVRYIDGREKVFKGEVTLVR